MRAGSCQWQGERLIPPWNIIWGPQMPAYTIFSQLVRRHNTRHILLNHRIRLQLDHNRSTYSDKCKMKEINRDGLVQLAASAAAVKPTKRPFHRFATTTRARRKTQLAVETRAGAAILIQWRFDSNCVVFTPPSVCC